MVRDLTKADGQGRTTDPVQGGPPTVCSLRVELRSAAPSAALHFYAVRKFKQQTGFQGTRAHMSLRELKAVMQDDAASSAWDAFIQGLLNYSKKGQQLQEFMDENAVCTMTVLQR